MCRETDKTQTVYKSDNEKFLNKREMGTRRLVVQTKIYGGVNRVRLLSENFGKSLM